MQIAAMQWDHGNGLRRLYFPAIEAISGFFHGIFASGLPDRGGDPQRLNLGLGCGTADRQVWRNRRRVMARFGLRTAGVYARQVHGTAIGVWDDAPDTEPHVLDGDALITQRPGTGLVIQVADCQPLIIVDPSRQVAANVHSGWRGSVQNIIGAVIECLVRDFGCSPRDLVCGVGPSLGPCCAEFVNYARELPEDMWRLRRAGDLFDFWRLSREQLMAAGVDPANIHVSGICTRCNQHLFYSYRGDRRTGRFAAVIGMKDPGGPKP